MVASFTSSKIRQIVNSIQYNSVQYGLSLALSICQKLPTFSGGFWLLNAELTSNFYEFKSFESFKGVTEILIYDLLTMILLTPLLSLQSYIRLSFSYFLREI